MKQARHEVFLRRTTLADRAAVDRLALVPDLAPYVHWNHVWFDRALSDPNIHLYLVVRAPGDVVIGCLALGPYEAVDGDPASRSESIGEIYHLVIDRAYVRHGYARIAIIAAIDELASLMPSLEAVRLGHHPDNTAAANLYGSLGFCVVGEKVDAETGLRDVLRERRLQPSAPKGLRRTFRPNRMR